jgi:hypothetical protein
MHVDPDHAVEQRRGLVVDAQRVGGNGRVGCTFKQPSGAAARDQLASPSRAARRGGWGK